MVTSACPSVGLACIFKRKAHFTTPIFYHHDEFFLTIRVRSTILINSYFPHDNRSGPSITIFARACASLRKLIKRLVSQSLNYTSIKISILIVLERIMILIVSRYIASFLNLYFSPISTPLKVLLTLATLCVLHPLILRL